MWSFKCEVFNIYIQRIINQLLSRLMSEYFRRYIKKQHYQIPPSSIKFKTTFKNCVYNGLLYREWKQTRDDDWDIIWCEKEQVNWVFQRHHILPHMKINHFRGWYQLCRKDMLNKNLKKFKRNLKKQDNIKESNEYDFLPTTFQLPSEYVIFYQEFKKTQNDKKNLWIMKPVHSSNLTSKSQGKGIFLFNKIGEISKWKNFNKDNPPQPYVCQRYLLNPLLFGGKKFDMRIYALCTSYQPLTIYLYRAGFARFAQQRFDKLDLDNPYKHLTNVVIKTNAPKYVKQIGGKWSLSELKKFMFSKLGIKMTNGTFYDIQRCITKSLLAVQKLVTNSPNSFQLYGFDFIFDSDGKAWLLEVNGNPSMTSNTKEDADLKVGLIDDVMTINNLEGILKGDEKVIGGFDMIYKGKEVGIGSETAYKTMLGCNNRIDNIKKLAKATAFRLAKQPQEKNEGVGSNISLSNFLSLFVESNKRIKTSSQQRYRLKSKSRAPQKTIDSRKNAWKTVSAKHEEKNVNVHHKPGQQQQ